VRSRRSSGACSLFTVRHCCLALLQGKQGAKGKGGDDEEGGLSSAEQEEFRQRMENLVERQGMDEAYFDGKELARLIYEKYGRSYDVAFMRQVRVALHCTACLCRTAQTVRREPAQYCRFVLRPALCSEVLHCTQRRCVVLRGAGVAKHSCRIPNIHGTF